MLRSDTSPTVRGAFVKDSSPVNAVVLNNNFLYHHDKILEQVLQLYALTNANPERGEVVDGRWLS